jgi:hypothetical protein
MLTAAGAGKQLGILLSSLANHQDIAEVLNLDEPQEEGFWEVQDQTVKNRFYAYVLHDVGLPLTLSRKELTAEQAALLFTRAYRLKEKGLTYKEVRDWWLNQGMYLHASQFDAKREAEQLAKTCLRVLVFPQEGGAKYLAYDEQHQPILVPDAAEAFQFPVTSQSQLAPQKLLEDAKHFRGLVGQLNAKQVKLLPGQKV